MHQKCSIICGKKYGSCSHNCPRSCHVGGECGLCEAPCEVRCHHSRCDRKCSKPCTPCVERCTWSCEHQGPCFLPCSAPCDRLPCSQRCEKLLQCGHKCPSVCGETCPEGYCQTCSDRGDARVDMLEFKTYGEIDLDESPIVVLSCGHFFTAETLDGHVGMSEVYQESREGDFVALRQSFILSQFVPRCPDCQASIKQYATQRYNRVLNKAVLDDTSRRFIVSGDKRISEFNSAIKALEIEYQQIKQRSPQSPTVSGPGNPAGDQKAFCKITMKCDVLSRAIRRFTLQVSDGEQPVRKLYEATVKATRSGQLADKMASLSMQNVMPGLSPDQRIVSESQAIYLKLRCMMLNAHFEFDRAHRRPTPAPGPYGLDAAVKFLANCEDFISDTSLAAFPRLCVEVQLYYARIAFMYRSSPLPAASELDTGKGSRHDYTPKVKRYLQEGETLCAKGFQGAENLLAAVQASMKLADSVRYETMTKEELESIKVAMVSGRGGMATHSGHWYNCENGHPVCIALSLPSRPFSLIHVTVCCRRVWDANGTSSLSRMRRCCWRYQSPSGRGGYSCY
ncbi:hypothetical protein BDV06DRAFT_129741 [Aspergillus oleicola]